MALGDLYEFAGKPRTVDMSKGGFRFPAALHLNTNLQQFDAAVLAGLKNEYESHQQLIEDIAVVHAELLFIHPFREGNGRTARLLANLMAEKAGHALITQVSIWDTKTSEGAAYLRQPLLFKSIATIVKELCKRLIFVKLYPFEQYYKIITLIVHQ